jgi:hypothetical protein
MSEAKGAADGSTDVSREERVFIDSEGGRWRVYEQAFSAYDRRSSMSLIFANDAAMRRVRSFPPDWAQLSDEELLRLSWKA